MDDRENRAAALVRWLRYRNRGETGGGGRQLPKGQ